MASENGTFPAADAEKELNPDKNKEFEVDPVSSKVAEVKEQKTQAVKELKTKKKDAVDTLKSTLIVSGIVVVVAGAVFAITKKLKEK